jgi:hypothetical protein
MLPLTLGEQGPLLSAGVPAVLVQRSGESGPSVGDSVADAPANMGGFGRGILAAISAFDAGPEISGAPTRDLLIGSRVLPSWSIGLLVLAAILPVALSAIDILARTRRRRAPVARWSAWLLLGALPFVLAGLFAVLLGKTGLLPATPPEPVSPRALPLDGAAAAALVSVVLVFALAWLLRIALVRRLGAGDLAQAPGAATAMILVLSGLALVVWVFNPFAAALLVLPLHLWMLATTIEPQPPRRLALGVVALGALPLLAVLLLYTERLRLAPPAFAWMTLLAIAGGHIPVGALLAWSLAGSCLVAACAISHRRAAARPDDPLVTVRGPVSYAGPGSLGGTDSAMRR